MQLGLANSARSRQCFENAPESRIYEYVIVFTRASRYKGNKRCSLVANQCASGENLVHHVLKVY